MLTRHNSQTYQIITESVIINNKGQATLSYPIQGSVILNSAEVLLNEKELISVRVKLDNNKLIFPKEFSNHKALISYLTKTSN